MSISKISRGLIVAIFTALIILLILTNLQIIFNNEIIKSNIIGKVIYTIVAFSLISIYAFIKEKLSKKRVKKIISLIYRFLFLSVITFLVKIIIIYNMITNISMFSILICAIMSVFSALVLKKIIYNISKSDLLSVTGMIMYALLPNIVVDKLIYFNMTLLALSILLVVLFMQKLIDELKQLGIKTKKYIFLSVATGLFIGITLVLNLNSLIWLILVVLLMFITVNLDKTNINFPKKILNKLNQKNKENLYRIERIYINKVFISVIVILLCSYLSYFTINKILFNTSNFGSIKNIIIDIKNPDGNNLINNIKAFKTVNINDIISNFKSFISNSKGYYLILCIYILFIEILTVILRRRYDTKSTIIKILFILVFDFYALFNLDVLVYSHLLTILLILICIINTSNLYLNRDERIKLLNS